MPVRSWAERHHASVRSCVAVLAQSPNRAKHPDKSPRQTNTHKHRNTCTTHGISRPMAGRARLSMASRAEAQLVDAVGRLQGDVVHLPRTPPSAPPPRRMPGPPCGALFVLEPGASPKRRSDECLSPAGHCADNGARSDATSAFIGQGGLCEDASRHPPGWRPASMQRASACLL